MPKTAPLPALRIHWMRRQGFILGLIAAVALAFILPGPGSPNSILHPELLTNFGIALIMFLQGLSLAFEKIKSGASHWRLHLVIQSFTFVVFPVVGLLLNALLPWLWPDVPEGIRSGFLYLCVLPSTVSTSVVLTAVAGGNTPGALFNAAFSNILGVMITPALVNLLMQSTGAAQPFTPLLFKIALLTLAPFAAGMILRNYVHHWVDARKAWVNRLSNAVILFIVYAAFCESVEAQIWDRYGWALTLQTFALVAGLFAVMSGLIFAACAGLRLNREDRIAAYFCSVKKTLAMGVPLALLIFGDRGDLPLILLPIMFFHPLQLLVNGLLANRWAQAQRRESD